MTPTEYRLIVAEEQERTLAERLAGFGLGVVTRRHNVNGTGARASNTRQVSPQNVTRATVEEAPNPKPTSPGSAHPAFGLPYDDLVGKAAPGTEGAEATDYLTLPHWRKSESVKALRAIADRNPDTALALSTARRVAATPLDVRVYRIGATGPTEEPDDAAALEVERLLARSLAPWGGGIEAMRDMAMDSLLVQGAAAFELEVAPNLKDATDIIPVDPTRVRWKAARHADGRGYVRPYYVAPGSGMGSGADKAFNDATFCYVALDATATDPHGKPFILPALDSAPSQSRMRNVLHKVVVQQGFGRLVGKVNWDAIAATLPDGLTDAQKRAQMQGALGAITNSLRQLKPDDALAVWDFIELAAVGAQHGSQSLKPKELADLYDTDLAAGLKTPPALLGRSTGQALSTNADVQWKVYAQTLEGLRERALMACEGTLTRYLRLRGIAAYVVLEAEPIEKTDAMAEETTAKTRQERLIAARDAGLVDSVYARDAMGYPEMAEPIAAPAADAQRLTAQEQAAIIAELVADCPHCGARNLRRKPGQQKCRACGVYMEARRSLADTAEPEPADLLEEAAADLLGQPLSVARAYVDAYADSLDALSLDDECDCEDCRAAYVDAQRGSAPLNAKGRALGAGELSEYSSIGPDDLERAVKRWRAWAERAAPEYVSLLDAERLTAADSRRATSDEPVDAPSGGTWILRMSAKDKGWAWEERSLSYRPKADPERPISGKTVAGLLEDNMAAHRAAIADATRALTRGELTTSAWQRRIADSMRDAHLQARALAVGGRDRMTSRDFGSVGGFMRYDTQRLARFAAQVESGAISAAQAEARAQLYGQANIRRSYERGRLEAAKGAGFQQERRVLAGSAAHCAGCADEAGRGWVQLGSLAPIGGHECKANDRCGKEVRYSAASQTVPRVTTGTTTGHASRGVGTRAPRGQGARQEGRGLAWTDDAARQMAHDRTGDAHG
jgi:hypothetical protein